MGGTANEGADKGAAEDMAEEQNVHGRTTVWPRRVWPDRVSLSARPKEQRGRGRTWPRLLWTLRRALAKDTAASGCGRGKGHDRWAEEGQIHGRGRDDQGWRHTRRGHGWRGHGQEDTAMNGHERTQSRKDTAASCARPHNGATRPDKDGMLSQEGHAKEGTPRRARQGGHKEGMPWKGTDGRGGVSSFSFFSLSPTHPLPQSYQNIFLCSPNSWQKNSTIK